jgi:hypothetical protein
MLSLVILKRPVNGRALLYLFAFRVGSHIGLFVAYGDAKTYLIAYCLFTYIQAALFCWALESLAFYRRSALYYCILFSFLAAVVSMYFAPQASFVTLVLQAANRLCWLAPTSFLVWGIIDPPPQVSRRTTFLYLGFVIWIVSQFLTSFSQLANLTVLWQGVHTSDVLYLVAATAWTIGLTSKEPELSLARLPAELQGIVNSLLSTRDFVASQEEVSRVA